MSEDETLITDFHYLSNDILCQHPKGLIWPYSRLFAQNTTRQFITMLSTMPSKTNVAFVFTERVYWQLMDSFVNIKFKKVFIFVTLIQTRWSWRVHVLSFDYDKVNSTSCAIRRMVFEIEEGSTRDTWATAGQLLPWLITYARISLLTSRISLKEHMRTR